MVRARAWREYDFARLSGESLFFYVGAGLSQAAGLVGWNGLTDAISRFRREYENDSLDRPPPADTAEQNAAYLRRFIEETGAEGHPILSRSSRDIRTYPRTVVVNLLLRQKRDDCLHELTERDLELHSAVWRTHCQGVFTTNYDMLLEHAFSLVVPSERASVYGNTTPLRTYRYYARFLPYLLSVPRFVLKLHGDVDDIGTMLFDPQTAWEPKGALYGQTGEDLRRVFDAAQLSSHMIYVGCGGRDRTFRELHEGRTKGGEQRERLFFVPAAEVDGISKAMGPTVDDLQFLTYGTQDERLNPHEGAHELREFLERVADGKTSRSRLFSQESMELSQQLGGAVVHRAWFTPRWNVSGVPLCGAWTRGVPPSAGLYLWRRPGDQSAPFVAAVRAEAFGAGLCISPGSVLRVTLDGRVIWWRNDPPSAASHDQASRQLAPYEWIGPHDA